MRPLLVLAALLSLAALTVAAEAALGPAAGLGISPGAAGAGHLPLGALFTFAVSAFQGPLQVLLRGPLR